MAKRTPAFDTESVAYHAARLLLLIDRCGRPRSGAKPPGIKGRTLLAKLDFFLRYPTYLVRAARMAEPRTRAAAATLDALSDPAPTVEAPMVRYKYGPWDHAYYVVLAYLIGKGLVEVDIEGRTEVFRVTEEGRAVASELADDGAYAGIAHRADAVRSVFGTFTGSRLKAYIYERFPEVVARDYDEPI
ncbi:MAG: hypothetical protein AAGK21_00115 [Bacteroidota bacterium]